MQHPRLLPARTDAHRALLPCLVAALLLASAGVGIASALDWQLETVDPAAHSVSSISLALDDAGAPGIGYVANGELRYAARNGSAWEVRSVEAGVSAGRMSLALDAGGNPRIAYIHAAHNDLRYAAWDGAAWQIQTVDRDGIGEPSLVLDGAGRPRVSYIDRPNATVRYAAFDGLAWRAETVDQAGSFDWGTCLALDVAGLPSIAYGGADQVRIARYSGTAWQIEGLGPVEPGEPGAHPSLVLDGAGTPRIASYDPATDALLYRVRDGAGWRTEWIDANGDVLQHASLALDAAGTPGISSFARWSYISSRDSGFRYAGYNRSSRQWETGTVDGASWNAGEVSSLALDGGGSPRIAYSSDLGLKFARADLPGPVVSAVPGGAGRPTATDGDGVYDDVNGNGRRDFADVVLYFNQMSWIAANEPPGPFDYTGNGRVDFADVVRLFERLGAPARGTFTVTAGAIGPGIVQPSGHLLVREGEDVTFTLHVGPGVPLPHATQSGVIVGNEVVVDPAVMPTLHPDNDGGYGHANFTSSYTLRDVRANHTVYGVFYRAGWITC